MRDLENFDLLSEIVIPLVETLADSQYQYDSWANSPEPGVYDSFGIWYEELDELCRSLRDPNEFWRLSEINRVELQAIYQQVRDFSLSIYCKEHLSIHEMLEHPEWKKIQKRAEMSLPRMTKINLRRQ